MPSNTVLYEAHLNTEQTRKLNATIPGRVYAGKLLRCTADFSPETNKWHFRIQVARQVESPNVFKEIDLEEIVRTYGFTQPELHKEEPGMGS